MKDKGKGETQLMQLNNKPLLEGRFSLKNDSVSECRQGRELQISEDKKSKSNKADQTAV